jgi:uncharacterized protein (TIGR02231 family)
MPEQTPAAGLTAPITGVTVFRGGARVHRTGTLRVEAGLHPVTIGDLPGSLDPASVRVAARGQDLALLDVEVHHRHRGDPLREETARLQAEVDRCRDAVQALDDEDTAEQVRLTFLGHLSESAATALARAVSFGRAGHDDLAEMAGHLSADTAGALGRRRGIAARKRAAQRELEAAERSLGAAGERPGHPAALAEVSVTLEARAATEAEVEVSYHVPEASWRPLYDLTLDGGRLSVSYLAEVTQQTGEDWPAAELALSTTRHGRHHTLPGLSPWYLSRVQPVPAERPRLARAAAAPASGGGVLFAAAQAAPLAAEPEDSETGQIYHIQRPLTVPADGGPHKTLIDRFTLDAAVDHLAVPVLAAEAYLRATVTNSSPLLLLPGPARVFHAARFVGETAVATVASGEEFELQLGVDDQIRVERTLRRRDTSKAMIGGSRTIDIGYEITVRNHRQDQAKVSVHDHIPVSKDGDIKVRLRDTSPNPTGHTDLGELTWDLTQAPGQAATIRYRFTVEHPAQLTVTGL